jgi:pimeloyl-ACP methyl ester carboxylesterase
MRRSLLLLVGAFVVASVVVTVVGTAPVASLSVSSVPPTESRVSFRSGSDTLSGILSLPAGDGRRAAVVLLSGSERGGTTSSYLIQNARILAGAGFAVLRYDPPGVGRSTGSLRFETLDGRAREANAAVEYLRSRPEIRPDEIGLWGHSQGGWVTQMAAATSRHVAFIVSASGSGVSVAEQQVYSVEAQSRAAGFPASDIVRAGVFARMLVDSQLSRPLYRAQALSQVAHLGPGPWRTFATLVYTPGQLTPTQRLQRGISILKSIRGELWANYLYLDTAVLPALEAIPPGQVAAARAAAQKSLLVQPKKYLSAVRCPVLAIWGADDTLVPTRMSASIYRQYLKVAGNHDVTLVVLANAGHSLNDFGAPYQKTLTGWLTKRFGP